jgi:hypothetical protein
MLPADFPRNNEEIGRTMTSKKVTPKLSLTMAIVSFLVALIPLSGLVLKGDVTGRIIFTAVWLLVGLAWLGGFFRARRRATA